MHGNGLNQQVPHNNYLGVIMSNNQTARIAGFIYLIVVLTGFFNLVYVPSELIVWSDTTLTVNNIMQSEFLFRLGIVAGIFSYICFAILPFALYKLFEKINKTQASFMLLLALVSVPISIFNIINKVDVLSLLSGAQYLASIELEQLQTEIMLLLKSYNNGISVVQIFWGLWLFPFGLLVFKSGFLPRLLGILLIIGCFGYLIGFISDLLFTNINIPFIGIPGAVGEIGICLWLLFIGVKSK